MLGRIIPRRMEKLFGHVHSGSMSQSGKDFPRLRMLLPRQYDVGVDDDDYRPVLFAEVKAIIEAQVSISRESNE